MPFISFLLFVIVSSFTPGPNNIMAMTFANQIGLKRSLIYCAGVGGGFFVITLLCTVFNLLLTNLLPVIETPLMIFGAAYMLYLAYKILTSNGQSRDQEPTHKNLFWIGVLMQFINPKGILYSIAVVATYILPYYSTYFSYFMFALALGFVGFLSTFSWSLFGSLFQSFISKHRKPFNIIMALLLVYCAISIIYPSL